MRVFTIPPPLTLLSGQFSYLHAVVEEGQNVLVIHPLSGHLLGAVLAHSDAVAVAAAPDGEGAQSALLVSGGLVNGDIGAWKIAPSRQGFSVIFLVYKLRASESAPNLAFPAYDSFLI